jgi:hypothetical protein
MPAHQEQEARRQISVNLDLSRVDWTCLDVSAAAAAKFCNNPELSPEEYVTYLLANAYYYMSARRVGAIEVPIQYTTKAFNESPPIPFPFHEVDVRPFPMDETMTLSLPEHAVTSLVHDYGDLESALCAMQDFMDQSSMTFLQKKGNLMALDFGEMKILYAFPFLRSLDFVQTRYQISQLHSSLQ